MTEHAYSAGLEGVVAGETAISTVGKKGRGLSYRGYPIEELATHVSFEEVAHLLIHGNLPGREELEAYRLCLRGMRRLPGPLKIILEELPGTSHPMDVLRTGCSAIGTLEPEREKHDARDIADRLLSALPGMLLYWHHYHHNGHRVDTDSGEETLAGHILHLLHGRTVRDLHRRALDVSLILYAEHEFNASTFSARVTASTLTDFYSAVTSAIGTLRGPLHGGANEEAMRLIDRFATPDEAAVAVRAMLAGGEKIMGFGHRIYRKAPDPRSAIIKEWSRKLAESAGDLRLFRVSERIETLVREEKGLYPNLDFYSASAYHHCGIPSGMFTPVFVFARVAGWAAHIIEQRASNRIFRPVADYVGPGPRAVEPIRQRAGGAHAA
ncbi:MAG TPA: citrate/2-methylcitrate synthase [Candidatus Deferrimicrobiaceae bacterium]|jgi:2-methylcitrate synthase